MRDDFESRARAGKRTGAPRNTLPKVPTGIAGLDEITLGGLPRGRPTLVCGGAGCGKTLFGMEFLIHGALECGEPGVVMTFEETARDLSQNVRSLGYDLDRLVADKKIAVDHVHVDRSEIEETGEYDLDGLFLRLDLAVNQVKAKRVVLDTVEALFSGFGNPLILRGELRRLFRWLKDRDLTTVITGERGEGTLTRHGLEEYVSDCVILLDHRVIDQISTRRLRIVKYRGTTHGTNEFPFLIDAGGISVLPLTSLRLDHGASDERMSSGTPGIDSMLGGRGVFRGSTVLVSGGPGTGKSSVGAHFVDAACRRGERCLLLAFEESPNQILRNMRAIGLDLERWVKKGRLRIESSRPTLHGLEMHLVRIHGLVEELQPDAVVVDPISTFFTGATEVDADSMILRLVDFLKERGITSLLTHPVDDSLRATRAEFGMTSLIDTWITLRDVEEGGQRRRELRVLKSRGMPHSTRVHRFAITEDGLRIESDANEGDRDAKAEHPRGRKRPAAKARAEGNSR
jgi:circadian clock protein KaiC